MNILLFVTSLLMILSLLTYARIDSFRYFLGMDAEFERYMASIERSHINTVAKQWYDTTTAPRPKTKQSDSKPPSTPQKNKGPSAARLSFLLFINPKKREKDPEAYVQAQAWAKSLMMHLYGDKRFFIEALQRDPNILDQILEGLGYTVQQLPDGKRPTKAAELANLELDGKLQEVFYHMLKGSPYPENQKPKKSTKSNIIEFPPVSDNADEEETAAEAQEYTKEGWDSLLNYITLNDATRIRVYLAPRELLTAIFGQAAIAEEIIKIRQTLYKAVNSDSISAEEATQQFTNMLKSMGNINEKFLDFKVSKTNPSTYH